MTVVNLSQIMWCLMATLRSAVIRQPNVGLLGIVFGLLKRIINSINTHPDNINHGESGICSWDHSYVLYIVRIFIGMAFDNYIILNDQHFDFLQLQNIVRYLHLIISIQCKRISCMMHFRVVSDFLSIVIRLYRWIDGVFILVYIMLGDNIVVSAPSGSGKTVIFELAIIELLIFLERTGSQITDYKIIHGKYLYKYRWNILYVDSYHFPLAKLVQWHRPKRCAMRFSITGVANLRHLVWERLRWAATALLLIWPILSIII